MEAFNVFDDAINTALSVATHRDGGEATVEATVLRDLSLRLKKLRRAWSRPQAVGLFGPSQAGKSFLVGALLAHETGSLAVRARDREVDFLKELNPAKGVESTGVVTRFTTQPGQEPTKGDFVCTLLPFDAVLASLATGFLVECTFPSLGVDVIDRTLRDAKMQAGAAAPPVMAEAWNGVWHELLKKYQDRHPYLNDLRRHALLASGAWRKDITTVGGWLMVFSLLFGGPGHAPDLEDLLRRLSEGLSSLGYVDAVEVGLGDVRAASDRPSILDASCLNTIGQPRPPVQVYPVSGGGGQAGAIDPGVLAGLIAEVRLPLRSVPGTLLSSADILDFPGGRALKGINGFGKAELSTGKLDNAIEVYKRGKLTFLFEQYAHDREITALVLCSPGPTKPEAIQLQSQVEAWLKIRYGASTPTSSEELEQPSLFLALTKFDMSLGALRSDNARDRWDSRVQEACIDFWSRGGDSWPQNWGAKSRPFTNLYWVRNPFADQMQCLQPGDADFDAVKNGYLASRAVSRHIRAFEEKWAAVEGTDSAGAVKSGIPILATALREKLKVDVKRRELSESVRAVRSELLGVLRALTPSRDDAEARARMMENADALSAAIGREMTRRASGSVFGELLDRLVVPLPALELELAQCIDVVTPMSLKASDKVKRVLVHVLKWWEKTARERVREAELNLPLAHVDAFVQAACMSKVLLPTLGTAVFPYFNRTEVPVRMVAEILHLKMSDGMLSLGLDAPRATPKGPVRLSYSESGAGGLDAVDWTDVDFSSDAPPSQAQGLEIVFAGRASYKRWSGSLGEFYVKSGGQKVGASTDAAIVSLVAKMGSVERADVGA